MEIKVSKKNIFDAVNGMKKFETINDSVDNLIELFPTLPSDQVVGNDGEIFRPLSLAYDGLYKLAHSMILSAAVEVVKLDVQGKNFYVEMDLIDKYGKITNSSILSKNGLTKKLIIISYDSHNCIIKKDKGWSANKMTIPELDNIKHAKFLKKGI